MKLYFLVIIGLMAGVAARATTVTITEAKPIERLDGAGRVSSVSMASVGATFTLVKADGDSLLLRDAAGSEFRVGLQATDYVALSPAAVEAATNAANSKPATATATVQPTPDATSGTLSDGEANKIKQLNDALGISLLADAQFWQNDVADVAQRLGWPEESKTSTEESFRRYAQLGEAPILGASAYSLALYGKAGKPTYLSLIFANAGDFSHAQKTTHSGDAAGAEKKELAAAVKKDAETITAALTPILGAPGLSLFGNSSSNRDEVHRWDWKGVAFLLNSHQGEYASLKILPSVAADRFGTVEVTDRGEMRDLLAKRVVRRGNGDVLVSDLPMVDQGPKGYCVPATWERYLRYMDVPADLYVLAILGHSGLGGGTNSHAMEMGVADYVSAYHRRIESYDAPLDVAHVSRYIDQGLPLMWTCWIAKAVEDSTNANTQNRKSVTDWGAYAKNLPTQDAALGKSFQAEDSDHSNGHMRLIIGYNAATDEIAISDSWGADMAERWMYAGTAKRISAGELSYLSW